MILQELCEYYDILDGMGKVAKQGYCVAKVHYAIILNNDGTVSNFLDLQNGTKPALMPVPEQLSRSGKNPPPYFLCDKFDFVLGEKFEVFKEHNLKILNDVKNPQASAFRAFLENGPTGLTFPDDKNFESKNFVFMLGFDYIHENPEIKTAWENSLGEGGTTAQCLLTGKKAPIARLHHKIRGVKGAQSAGANLISFQKDSGFDSYGKEQGYNAPLSESATFKYGTILNHMLQSDSTQKMSLGDSTVVFWAQSPSPKCTEVFNAFLSPSAKMEDNKTDDEKTQDKIKEKLVEGVLYALKNGQNLSGVDEDLDGNANFCILALAPNNARISVRFFYKDTFADMLKKIALHYDDMEVVNAKLKSIPIWLLVNETVHKEGDPSPLLAGRILNAILSGGLYPSSLFATVIKRVYAEQDINYIKAGIIKAYLTRKYRAINHKLKEELKVSLNEELKEPAYLFGRLFATLEQAQWKALGDTNSGVKERFFASAASSPKRIFPQLLKNVQNHLAKMDNSIWLDKKIGEIMSSITEFPVRLNLDEQGLFMLGYYHQRQDFFTKKETAQEV